MTAARADHGTSGASAPSSGPAPAGARVRLTPDARREQLLDLGLQLLTTRRLDELSIDLLADEAGISRGLLYHYFRNKREFHRAVVRRAADELIAVTAPDPALDPVARLTASLEAYVDYVQTNHAPYTSLVRGAASGDPMLREIYEDARRALTGRIYDSLGDFDLTETAAVRLMANGWAAMVEETVLSWVEQQQVPKQELLRVLANVLPAVLLDTSAPAPDRRPA